MVVGQVLLFYQNHLSQIKVVLYIALHCQEFDYQHDVFESVQHNLEAVDPSFVDLKVSGSLYLFAFCFIFMVL